MQKTFGAVNDNGNENRIEYLLYKRTKEVFTLERAGCEQAASELTVKSENVWERYSM